MSLPEGWAMKPISEITRSISNGFTYTNAPGSGGLPISRIQTISHGYIDFDAVGYAAVPMDAKAGFLLEPGDILFSHINSKEHVGKVAIYRSDMPPLLHGMNLLRVVANDSVLPEYLFWAIRSDAVKSQIYASTRHAVNQASINIRNLLTVMIPVPPLDEQRRIVAALEDHISRLDKALAELEDISSMANVLTGRLLDEHFYGQESTERTLLGRHVDFTSGFSFKSQDWLPSGIPVVKIGNIQVDRFDGTSLSFVSPSVAALAEKAEVVRGDLLLTLSGATLGASAIYADERVARLNQRLAKLKVKDAASFLTPYVHLFLRSPQTRRRIYAEAQGAAQPNISHKAIALFDLPNLSQEAQESFIANFEELQRSCVYAVDAIVQAKIKVKLLKRAILKSAFSGELV